nr:hypothetical protein GCM10020063_026780 [Dactylosporangium thailandense]
MQQRAEAAAAGGGQGGAAKRVGDPVERVSGLQAGEQRSHGGRLPQNGRPKRKPGTGGRNATPEQAGETQRVPRRNRCALNYVPVSADGTT